MAICRPIFPTEMLNSQNQIVLPDIDAVLAAQSNPTLNYNSNDLRVATVLFNTIVPFLNFQKYDFIKQRFLKPGQKNLATIGEAEFADALYDAGIAPDDFAVLVIEDSPLPINVEDVLDLIEEFDKVVNDQVEAEVGGVIVDVGVPKSDGTTPITVQQPDGSLSDIDIPTPTTGSGSGAPAAFPPVFSTTTPIVPVAGIGGSPAGTDDPETTEDDNETGIDTTEEWEPGPKLDAALSILNKTYGDLWVENNEIDSDSCKFGATNILPPLFGKLLSQVIDRRPFISGIRGFISNVQSLVQINITHILGEVIGPLQAAVEKVNQLAIDAFARVEGIFSEAQSFLSGLGGWAPDKMANKLYDEFMKYSRFFSEFNVESIRRKLKEFAHIMELRLDPQTLAGVLPRITQDLVKKNIKYRSCKFSGIVDELFKKVTNEFRKFKDSIFGAYNASSVNDTDWHSLTSNDFYDPISGTQLADGLQFAYVVILYLADTLYTILSASTSNIDDQSLLFCLRLSYISKPSFLLNRYRIQKDPYFLQNPSLFLFYLGFFEAPRQPNDTPYRYLRNALGCLNIDYIQMLSVFFCGL